MTDPGFLSAAIGVLLQTLISKMLEWISIAKSCNKELDKLKDRLLSTKFFFEAMKIYFASIGSLPGAVKSWITKLENILEEGSKFVVECIDPTYNIFRRGKMARNITRFNLKLTEHLGNSALLALIVHNLHLDVKISELTEAVAKNRIPASAGSPTPSQEFSYDERLHARLEVHITSGPGLAIRDRRKGSSDLYVVAKLGGQKRKTGFIRKNLNPRWDQKFDMPVPSQSQPHVLVLKVYGKGLSKDDFMGSGTVDLTNLAQAAEKLRTGALSSMEIDKLKKDGIKRVDGHLVQKVCLKLEIIESGKLYLYIKWVDSPRPSSCYH